MSEGAGLADPQDQTAANQLSAQTTVVGHSCNVLMGNDGSTEGVHCADLAFRQSGNDWEIWPVGQALCQTISGGVEKQCAGIRQNIGLFGTLSAGTVAVQLASATVTCGTFGGSACPATVRFQNSAPHIFLSMSPDASADVWAAMVDDRIVLPVSATPAGPGPNVASAHHTFTFFSP